MFEERNPWPEDTPETAGRHATLEALYHVALRLRQLCARENTRRNRRALNRTLWLYNAMAFGSVGELADAEWWVRAITTKQDPWIARYVQRDPLLGPVRERLADWIAFQLRPATIANAVG